jgi:DNA-binding NtrC family response regulator
VAVKRLLVSWIGNTDLLCMAGDLNGEERKEALRLLNRDESTVAGKGPIRTLTDSEMFNEVHLLSNYDRVLTDIFKKWVNCNPRIHSVKLTDPTNYKEVFEKSDSILAKVLSNRDSKTELCIHLSPGTPAMTAIWVLLGKSRYPATFYQTYQGKYWVTNIPFDLVVDFVPEVMRKPDLHFQHLVSLSPKEIKGFEQIVGNSTAIRIAAGRARRAALRDVPVLLLGESGTGKELFAHAIHNASHRLNKPFVTLNCAAIPKELLESELFGHKKGAFTGANADRKGAFETADGGTLFFDEIGECDLSIQAKLLRVLEPPADKGPCYRVFRRVGEDEDRASDVRVIAATNRDLLQAVRNRQFREDLFYRLAVITIQIPPLRERRHDIPVIAQSLLEQINSQFRGQEPGYKDKYICPATKKFMQNLEWPGNVRQLNNVLLQAAVMNEDDVIEKSGIIQAIAEIPGNTTGSHIPDVPIGEGFLLDEYLNSIRKRYLQQALDEADGVKTKAAKLLGMKNYQTLDGQLKRFGVKWSRPKE